MTPRQVTSLPFFQSSNISEVQSLFSDTEPMLLQQSWLPTPEENHLPAKVQVGHHDSSLLVFAEIPDIDIFNLADAPNLKTWTLGDVFEIFLQPEGRSDYLELHITPENFRLQYHFDSVGAPPTTLDDGTFGSQTWIQREEARWFVLAKIPFGILKIAPTDRLRFSFCRYDAFRSGKPPVKSSTSPHPIPKFHRPAEWGTMAFI